MNLNFERLVVANTGNDSLSVIELKSYEIAETIFLQPLLKKFNEKNVYINGSRVGPNSIARGNDDSILYTVNSYHNSVFKININKKTIEDIVFVGSFPCNIELLNDLILVVNSDSNSISIIDEKDFCLLEHISVGEKPYDIKFNKNDSKLYVANTGGYSIDVISLNNYAKETIKLDSNPLHFFIIDNQLYILSSQMNGICKSFILVFDLEKREIEKKVDIEGIVADMIVLENRNLLFITNADNGYLYKIDMSNHQITGKYYFGGMPNIILWDEGELLYITNALTNRVTIFNYKEEKIIKNIEVGLEPTGLLLI